MKTVAFILTSFVFMQSFAQSSPPASLQVSDLNTACLDKNIQAGVFSDFKFLMLEINEYDIRSNNRLVLNPCDNSSGLAKMIRGLTFLKYAQIDSPKKTPVIPNFTNVFEKNDAYSFVKKDINQFYFANQEVSPVWTRMDGALWVSTHPNVAKIMHPVLYSALAVHESAHNVTRILHTKCDHGNYKGRNETCDKSLEEKGAYFYEVEYATAIAKYGRNIHPVIRDSFHNLAKFRYQNAFREMPESKKLIYLANARGDLLSVDDTGKIQNYGQFRNTKWYDQKDGVLLTAYSTTDKSWKKFSVYSGVSQEKLPDFEAEYNTKTLKDRPLLTDRVYDPWLNGVIYDDYLEYDLKANVAANKAKGVIKIPFSGAERLIKPENCNGSKNKNFYIMTKTQTVYEAEFNEKTGWNFQVFKGCVLDWLNVTKWGDKKVGLTTDGTLWEEVDGKWTKMKQFENQKFIFLSDEKSDFTNSFFTK